MNMKKICNILVIMSAAAVCSCTAGEQFFPEDGEDGMLKVRHILPEMEVSTKASGDYTFYAWPYSYFGIGMNDPLLPAMTKGQTEYYNIPSGKPNVLFTTVGKDDEALEVVVQKGSMKISMRDTEVTSGLSAEILAGRIGDVTAGSATVYEVPVKRLTSRLTTRLIITDYEGNTIQDESISEVLVSYDGFYSEMTLSEDLSVVCGGESGLECNIMPGEENPEYRNFIPGSEIPNCSVKVTMAGGAEKTFQTSLGKVLEANRDYVVTFKLKKANGSANFILEEPNVSEDWLNDGFAQGSLFEVQRNVVLGKDAESSAEVTVNTVIPMDWDFALTSGSEYFSVSREQNVLTVTALAENKDESRNAVLRLIGGTGHVHDIFISQVNDSRQGIHFTKLADGIGTVDMYVEGSNIEIWDGAEWKTYQSGSISLDNIAKDEQITIYADYITDFFSDTGCHIFFTNCVSLVNLEIRLSELGSYTFETVALPALKTMVLDGSAFSGITFNGEFGIRELSLRNCENMEALDLTNLNRSLKKLNCYGCSKLKNVTIYPTGYTGDKLIEEIDFEGCSVMTGASLGGYTSLKKVRLSYCSAMKTINLSGCTALKDLDIRNNPSTFLNLTNCTSLLSIYLRSMNIDKIVHTGCNALETIEVESSVAIKEFDFSGKPDLKEIKLGTHLVCDNFNVSGCPSLELISGGYNIKSNNINVSNCPLLASIRVYFPKTTSQVIDMTGCTGLQTINFQNIRRNYDYNIHPELKELNISNSCISALDVSACSRLESVYYYSWDSTTDNGLASLVLPKSVKELTLEGLNYKFIQALDLHEYKALENVTVRGYSGLPEINLSGCTALADVSIYENDKLKTISLNGCSSLVTLNKTGYGHNDILESVDISGCAALQEFYMVAGKLTALDFSTCSQIRLIDCKNNSLTADGLNKMFETIPDRTSNVATGEIYIASNPGASTCDKDIMYNKNWYFAD